MRGLCSTIQSLDHPSRTLPKSLVILVGSFTRGLTTRHPYPLHWSSNSPIESVTTAFNIAYSYLRVHGSVCVSVLSPIVYGFYKLNEATGNERV